MTIDQDAETVREGLEVNAHEAAQALARILARVVSEEVREEEIAAMLQAKARITELENLLRIEKEINLRLLQGVPQNEDEVL